MVSRRLIPAVLAATCGLALLAASPAPPEDACRDLDLPPDAGGNKVCETVRVFAWGAADVCRDAGASQDVCGEGDGRDVDPAEVDAHQDSELHRALTSQRELSHPVSLAHAQVLSTHNSYNSYAYRPTPSRMDANQTYSLTDQLRMDVRRLELDVHWWADTEPGDGVDPREPVLCHATGPHAGCTFEIPLVTGLAEIDAWLDEHPDEVVMLRLETHLDGTEGRADAAADLAAVLGDHLYRPPQDGACTTLDLGLSFDDVRAANKQVLAVGDCGAGGGYPDLVWEDGPVRVESSYGGEDFDAATDTCGRDRATYDSAWVRYYDDATWVSAMAASPGEEPEAPAPEVVTEWMRCGVNQPGFDHLEPDDPRLAAAVWSWAEGEVDPAPGEVCAVHGEDGRFHSERCGGGVSARPFACRTPAGAWQVSERTGAWGEGAAACGDATFGVPRTGWDGELLRRAKEAAGVDEVWLAYRHDGTSWHLP